MRQSACAGLTLAAGALLACKMFDKGEPSPRSASSTPSASPSASAGPTATPRFAASGVWRGSFASPKWTGTVIGVVTEDGRARFVSNGGVQIVGRFKLVGNRVTGNFASYVQQKQGADLDIRATVVPATSLSGSYSSKGDTGVFQLKYGKEYEREAKLDSLADKWGGPGFGMTVDAAGKLSGKDAVGCDYSGKLTAVDPKYNAYELAVDVSGCRYKGSYGGLAFLTDNKGTDDRLAVGIHGDRYAYAGHLQRGQAKGPPARP